MKGLSKVFIPLSAGICHSLRYHWKNKYNPSQYLGDVNSNFNFQEVSAAGRKNIIGASPTHHFFTKLMPWGCPD